MRQIADVRIKMILNKSCFACGSEKLTEVLNLGDQPLANSYLKNQNDLEKVYPLKLCFCNDCTHLQLSHTVDPSELFEHYLYVTGTSQTLHEYCDFFVNLVKRYTTGNRVLDIACNDGTQLDYFKRAEFITYGIDPAKNLYDLSSKNHNVVCDYLTERSIKSFNTEFDVIVAQNVFAHNSYPKEFLEYCKLALAKTGRIFIQTSQADMVKNNEFDTIYHEHLSFFSVESFCTLANRVGLKVIDVLRTPVHGTSFVFVLSNDLEDHDKSDYFISLEHRLTLDYLKSYSANANKIIIDLKNHVFKYKENGYTIVGYGAAAKGNTILNFSELSLDYIVDDNPLKHGLYTPGMKIPILHPDTIISETKFLLIPLAWNFYEEIKKKVQARNPSAKFIRYFPEVKIE